MTLTRTKMMVLVPLVLIGIMSVTSYAASVSVTSATKQAEYGVYYNVTASLTAANVGFQTAAVSGSASAQPCTWAAGGNCQTAVTSGHFLYEVTVTLTASSVASTTYTVSVSWEQNTNTETSLGSLTFTTPATITAGQSMTFIFDLGSASFTAPSGIDVTVA